MAKHILYCKKCSTFTMKTVCVCGEKAVTSKPPKYSPEDRYGSYRRKVKQQELKQKEWL